MTYMALAMVGMVGAAVEERGCRGESTMEPSCRGSSSPATPSSSLISESMIYADPSGLYTILPSNFSTSLEDSFIASWEAEEATQWCRVYCSADVKCVWHVMHVRLNVAGGDAAGADDDEEVALGPC